MGSTLIYRLKMMDVSRVSDESRSKIYRIDPLMQHTSPKFFSKNRVSRSTRVDCSYRALSTQVGKPPGTLTMLVNLVVVELT